MKARQMQPNASVPATFRTTTYGASSGRIGPEGITRLPEKIYKLQPDRTVQLRGFDTFAAAASLHSASPDGFKVSGTFRDPADFAVAVLYDADNFYEHPSIKYLPDFNFNGLTLNFQLHYTDALQPIDSPKFNWIDWATLDCVLVDGSTPQVNLWENAMLAGSTFPAASATCRVVTSGAGADQSDRVTLWYQNVAFDYLPDGEKSVEYQFFAKGTGTIHSITVNGRPYSHTETVHPDLSGETNAEQAAALFGQMDGDPDVIASIGSTSNSVLLTVRPERAGVDIVVRVSDGYTDHPLRLTTADMAATALANRINATDWKGANTTHALLAASEGPEIQIVAARYGEVNVSGTSVVWASGHVFSGITPGSSILIAGGSHTVASVQSSKQLTLMADAGTAAGAAYAAPRGGRDGNLIQLYATWKTGTLTFDQEQFSLAGGSSDVSWNCSIDFTALGIDQLRQCWLTFAPSLVVGSYPATEWQAEFSNWQLAGPAPGRTLTGMPGTAALSVAGPGSVRIEESDSACVYTPSSDVWVQDQSFYSKYYARKTSNAAAGITVTYTCQHPHDLYIGTSLNGSAVPGEGLVKVPLPPGVTDEKRIFYSDRAVAGIRVDDGAEISLDCRLNTGAPLITRRLVLASVPAGRHTVTLRLQQAGTFCFDFLEAAVVSDVPDTLPARNHISPALDFDTDHTYKLSPARLMWIMDKLGYAGPMNEYLGVFWWNERVASGGSLATARVTFSGPFSGTVSLTLNGDLLQKTILPADTNETVARHFAAYINSGFVGAWAAASGPALTVTQRSPAAAYNLTLTSADTGVAIALSAPGAYPVWVIDDAANPPINRATRDWHADFYARCAGRDREVATACSMELVNPPDGYVARFPDPLRTAVSTATGFGSLSSNHCAAGSTKLLAYQKAVYRNIAQMQSAAGLTPCVQYGEFLWWYFALTDSLPVGYASYTAPISIGTAKPHGLSTGASVVITGVNGNAAANGTWVITVVDANHFTLSGSSGDGTYTSGGAIFGGGMAFYDDETMSSALATLGRPLYVFDKRDDDPAVNGGADVLFLRNRLRDHVAALVADIRLAYPTVRCEVLWPYDVNHPTPVPVGQPYLGGPLIGAVNLPAEWRLKPSSGLDRMKVEALAFSSAMRNLDLAREAIELFPNFGWPLDSVRYLVPVFGAGTPWHRELALARGAGLAINNLWAFDHICLYNLNVPERGLERRSVVQSG